MTFSTIIHYNYTRKHFGIDHELTALLNFSRSDGNVRPQADHDDRQSHKKNSDEGAAPEL